jgi:hypothetical protein
MKKNIFLILLLISSNFILGQDIQELKLTIHGVESVQLDFNNLTTNQIYERSLMWVEETFVNAKDVLNENIENEKIKIAGFAEKAWWYKSMGLKNYNHMQYTVQLYFNNNQVTFNYLVGQFYMLEGPKTQYDYRMFFKKDGSIRKQYPEAVSSLELTMNSLLVSYYNYITGQSIQVETKDLNKYLTSLQTSLSKDSSNPQTHFELACFYSLIEDRDNAYKHLSEAINYNYKKLETIKTEPDLKWLRGQNDFKEFVANGYKFKATAIPEISNASTNNYIEELKELAKLKDEGIITEKEFNELKTKILERVKNE